MTIEPKSASGFHVMLKPRGAICNLDCSYCYFLTKQDLYPGSRFHMSDATLEDFTRQYIAAQPTSEVFFGWQGGEPTLLGVEFYEKAVAFQRKHARPGMRITNALIMYKADRSLPFSMGSDRTTGPSRCTTAIGCTATEPTTPLPTTGCGPEPTS